MHIILIGYRGTGKSAVGKILAEKLKMPYYDTDELIEVAYGRSINEMVAEHGWAYFRERECETIQGLTVLQGSVIATGGGVVMDEGNATILKKHGVLIWLRADVKTIVKRIQEDLSSNKQRPPFSQDDIVKETKDVLKNRIPVYSRLADYSIETTNKDVDEIVDSICQFLKETDRIGKKE